MQSIRSRRAPRGLRTCRANGAHENGEDRKERCETIERRLVQRTIPASSVESLVVISATMRRYDRGDHETESLHCLFAPHKATSVRIHCAADPSRQCNPSFCV